MADIKNVESKLDKIDARLDAIDITLAKQHVSLDLHIRRTEQNEEALEVLAKESNSRLKNLESWKDKFLGIASFLSALIAVALALKELGVLK
jgi:hypothetical protein